jgi:hypothetical protein
LSAKFLNFLPTVTAPQHNHTHPISSTVYPHPVSSIHMPRESRRATAIRKAGTFFRNRLQFRVHREATGDDDTDEDELDMLAFAKLQELKSTRYLGRRGNYRKSQAKLFDEDLGNETPGSGRAWLEGEEFLNKYRMSRDSFDKLLNLIEDNPVFGKKDGKGRKQAPPAHQLMILLHYLGTEGNGATNPKQRSMFRVGRGTSDEYRKRVMKAIRSLREQAIRWPDAEEREEIAKRIQDDFGLPNCVMLLDGTLFPLAFEPQREDAPDYSGRKFRYSLSTLIACDDRRFIRYYLAGWPGTAHDNRIFKSSKLFRCAPDFFANNEYMLGDSAFECKWFMVSACKSPRGAPMPPDHEYFNTIMAGPRVISEHCIGILKGRFPWLRSIRNKITEDAGSIKRILEYIECSIILHNLLLQSGDDIPQCWIDTDDFSDIGDPGIPEDDELNLAVPDGAPNDERRRQVISFLHDFGTSLRRSA